MSAPDNIITNFSKIAYTDYFPTDKILGTFSGTINVAGAGTFTNGFSQTAVNSGLSVKCFTQMSWSIDGGVTWQDGDATIRNYSGGTIQNDVEVTCYSSTTDIYIVVNNNGENATAPARTLKYKVIAISIT